MSGSYAETSPETDCYATASDNGGVARVEFYVDGALTNTERYAPYSCEFNTAAYPAGNHTLTAKAFDAAGNSGRSLATPSGNGHVGPNGQAGGDGHPNHNGRPGTNGRVGDNGHIEEEPEARAAPDGP